MMNNNDTRDGESSNNEIHENSSSNLSGLLLSNISDALVSLSEMTKAILDSFRPIFAAMEGIRNVFANTIPKEYFRGLAEFIQELYNNPDSLINYRNYNKKLDNFHWAWPYNFTASELKSLIETVEDEKGFDTYMYEYFGGVARILVPDNCRTAVDHNKGWNDQRINAVYQEMAEHYGTAIIPARVRAPKDKPNAEGSVGNISTWITAALRNEQFFSLGELNRAIRQKLEDFSHRPFQKKEGSRYEIFRDEEQPLLAPLPAAPYELAEWKQATVQFNYHISFAGMLYSVPYEYIKRKVDVRVTDKTIEIFYNHNRIASHRRLYGRKGQYSTVTEHMPESHQQYLEWNGDRFRKWAERIGSSTCQVVDAILTSKRVEQQSYRSCMGLLKLADKYSSHRLEAACRKALSFTATPSYKSIKNILDTGNDQMEMPDKRKATGSHTEPTKNSHALTRGADYYRR